MPETVPVKLTTVLAGALAGLTEAETVGAGTHCTQTGSLYQVPALSVTRRRYQLFSRDSLAVIVSILVA